MTSLDSLASRFAESRPRDVAELLALAPEDEIAEFLAHLAPQVSSPILANIASLRLHELMAKLPAELISKLFLVANQSDLVSMLSHLSTERYEEVMAATHQRDKAKLGRIFSFPIKTVSALAVPEFIRVNATTLCAQLRSDLAALTDNDERPIFVVGEAGTYLGVVSPLAAIADHNASVAVAQVMRRVEPLAGQTPIESALLAPQWHDNPVLPVVDAEGNILGSVSHRQLKQSDARSLAPLYGMQDVIEYAAISYLDLCSDLLDLGIGRDSK